MTTIRYRTADVDCFNVFYREAGDVPFLMKDVVLLAVSIHLLKQDVAKTLGRPLSEIASFPNDARGQNHRRLCCRAAAQTKS